MSNAYDLWKCTDSFAEKRAIAEEWAKEELELMTFAEMIDFLDRDDWRDYDYGEIYDLAYEYLVEDYMRAPRRD